MLTVVIWHLSKKPLSSQPDVMPTLVIHRHRLVPITQDQWTEAGLRDILLPDMEVKARIVKVT